MSASLEKGVRVLNEVIDAPIASYFSSCVHCGLCAEACLFYTENRGPKIHTDSQAGTNAPALRAGITPPAA